MILGQRSSFSDAQYQSFIDSGLVHLIAVSGTHMAIMIALASLLLFWVPFYLRIVLIGVMIVAYASLVGFHASVLRSVIMS